MERRISQVPAIDPVAERALFFLDLAIAEVTKTVPQATPQTSAKR